MYSVSRENIHNILQRIATEKETRLFIITHVKLKINFKHFKERNFIL